MWTPWAPNMRALRISYPDLIPPSIWTSIPEPSTASKIGQSFEIDERAPSNYRPPWFDTIIALAPDLTHILASSSSKIPFIINFPGQRSRTQATSSQFRAGSNYSAAHEDKDAILETPVAWPTMFLNWRLWVLKVLMHQLGREINYHAESKFIFGGAVKLFLISLCL
jgi:hypothetical protein